MSEKELSRAVEFIPKKVFYVALRHIPRETATAHFFSIDKELIYWNFYLDFGPLNLGQMFRFTEMLHRRLADPSIQNKKIYFYSGTHGNRRANAVCLLACWGVMHGKMSPEEAFRPFQHEPAFPPFHDATPCICPYKLTILDCLRGLAKAMKNNYHSIDTFDVDEYEHFEKVENGDLSWLSPKFIAFAGPHDTHSSSPEGYYTLTPEDYIPYFKRKNVTLVIRLNDKCYDEKRFLEAGIDHLSLIYPDGSNPPEQILKKFIQACEQTPGAVAVHCKAGLGRTGTCIGCYMMKHEKFTAREVIGWLRLCRPGSVIGPQQQFLEGMEKRMWLAGETTAEIQDMTSTISIKGHTEESSKSKTQGDNLVSAKRKQQMLIVKS